MPENKCSVSADVPLQQVFSILFHSEPVFLPVNVNTLIFLWYFYKYFTWNAVCILYFDLCNRDVSNKYNSKRPYNAIRNGCLFEWLFTRRICRLLDSQSGKEVNSGRKRGKTNFLFLSGVYSWVWNIPEQTVGGNQCGNRGGWGGRGGGQRLTNRWWWMETGLTVSAVRWADAALDGLMSRFSLRLRGKVWGSQPCLPRGPPCLRRQEPSSVSRAIFTKAWKLLLLSLRLSCEGDETDRYLHWRHSNHSISFHTHHSNFGPKKSQIIPYVLHFTGPDKHTLA